jgi:hypothetical protein
VHTNLHGGFASQPAATCPVTKNISSPQLQFLPRSAPIGSPFRKISCQPAVRESVQFPRNDGTAGIRLVPLLAVQRRAWHMSHRG